MYAPGSIAFHAFSPAGLSLGLQLAEDMGGVLYAPKRLLRDTAASGGTTPDGALPAARPTEARGVEPAAGRPASAAHDLKNHPPDLVPQAGQTLAHGFDSLADLMAARFHSFAAHVFIGATGIAVRAIAPHLRNKTVDPAVVVCEIHGRFVISLLSGHLGGANALARDVAERVGGVPVITTATDSENLPALDILARDARCRVADPVVLKSVIAALLAGKTPTLVDPGRVLALSAEERARFFVEADAVPPVSPPGADMPGEPPLTVVVGVRSVPAAPGRLRLYARRLYLGVGCRKGTPVAALLEAVRAVLLRNGLAEESVAALATATIKRDDPALREAADLLDAPLRFFSAAELAAVPTPHPTPKAGEVLGCDGPVGVSEGAALLAAGPGSELVVAKRIMGNVTVAVAMACQEPAPQT